MLDSGLNSQIIIKTTIWSIGFWSKKIDHSWAQYADNDSEYLKYRILYCDIGDSKNCSNFIKYTYCIYHMFYCFSEEK